MSHVVNRALTHAGNHKHGRAGHNLQGPPALVTLTRFLGGYFLFLRWDRVSARVSNCPSLFSTR